MAAETVTQTASVVNLHFVQGDTFRRELSFFRYDDDADPEHLNKLAQDVSTWGIAAQIRRRANSSTAVDFDVDMTDAATGTVLLTLAPEDAATLAENCFWDVQRVLAGDVRTIIAGTVTVDREVTR